MGGVGIIMGARDRKRRRFELGDVLSGTTTAEKCLEHIEDGIRRIIVENGDMIKNGIPRKSERAE